VKLGWLRIFLKQREKGKMEDVENNFRETEVNKLKQNANNRGKWVSALKKAKVF
jgi:hypothetical protein